MITVLLRPFSGSLNVYFKQQKSQTIGLGRTLVRPEEDLFCANGSRLCLSLQAYVDFNVAGALTWRRALSPMTNNQQIIVHSLKWLLAVASTVYHTIKQK